jgi:transposase
MEPMDTAFLPLPEGIVLESVYATQTTVVVRITCQHPRAACPVCQHPSERVQGHYTRTVADLPCGGHRILLQLSVRKFVCGTPPCPRQIFTERLPGFVQSYARMTNRLREALQALGFASGGAGGERLATKLGMQVTASTLLRQMRRRPLPPPEPVRILGLDDFAFRRGTRYHAPHNLAKEEGVSPEEWDQARPERRPESARDQSLPASLEHAGWPGGSPIPSGRAGLGRWPQSQPVVQ